MDCRPWPNRHRPTFTSGNYTCTRHISYSPSRSAPPLVHSEHPLVWLSLFRSFIFASLHLSHAVMQPDTTHRPRPQYLMTSVPHESVSHVHSPTWPLATPATSSFSFLLFLLSSPFLSFFSLSFFLLFSDSLQLAIFFFFHLFHCFTLITSILCHYVSHFGLF